VAVSEKQANPNDYPLMVPPEVLLACVGVYFAELVLASTFELTFRMVLFFFPALTVTPANARNAKSELAVRITL